MCKISLKSKLGFLTVLFSLLTVTFLMAIFGVGIVQSGLQQTSCNATNDNCVTVDCSDDFVVLTRPFRIDISYNSESVRATTVSFHSILRGNPHEFLPVVRKLLNSASAPCCSIPINCRVVGPLPTPCFAQWFVGLWQLRVLPHCLPSSTTLSVPCSG
jgi:hypothetical protein